MTVDQGQKRREIQMYMVEVIIIIMKIYRFKVFNITMDLDIT